MIFPEQFRRAMAAPYDSKTGDRFGVFTIPPQKLSRTLTSRTMYVIATAADDGEGEEADWEHVSASLKLGPQAQPTWEEMCLLKRLFWEPEACVVQFHPPAVRHINLHNGTLHLWRYKQHEFPTPPLCCV